MLREKVWRDLLGYAISDTRPKILTPEEFDAYEGMKKQIEEDHAKGFYPTYEIPTDLPEHGVKFTFSGYPSREGVSVEEALCFSVIAEEINRFYERHNLNFEDGSVNISWDPFAKALCLNRSAFPSSIKMAIISQPGIEEIIRQLSYGITACLIKNYEDERGNGKIEDLLCRVMELVLLGHFKRNWDSIGVKLADNDADTQKDIASLIQQIKLGDSVLQVVETAEEQDGCKGKNIYSIMEESKIQHAEAMKMFKVFKIVDLVPMIQIRAYMKNDGTLMPDWLIRNYPDSALIHELINA